MRALEDLQAQVRQPDSRRYLAEAIGSYQAGAFRPAIVATWVAVALDLVGKVREMAASGEGDAIVFTTDLDNAINQGNMESLTRFERDLLTTCRDRFELIDDREAVELGRLRSDRHVCAHPAFVRPEQVFNPTPELVRAHMSTAVDAVLSKSATPGKRAIDRFRKEIDGEAFPEQLDALGDYLRDRYFQRGKSSLRRGLAELIVKVAVDPPDGDMRRSDRCALASHALDRIEPELLREALLKVVRGKEESVGLSTGELLRFAGALGDIDVAWDALPDSSHHRVVAAIRGADLGSLLQCGVFERKLPHASAEAAAEKRAQLGVADLLETVSENPDLDYKNAAIKVFKDSSSFRQAERNMERLVLPIAGEMNPSDISAVMRAFISNNQIHYASGMPELMVNFFNHTEGDFPSCTSDWYVLRDFVTSLDTPGGHYSYPDLQERISETPPF